MSKFRDWKISKKVMGILVLTILLILLGMMLYFLPYVDGEKTDG